MEQPGPLRFGAFHPKPNLWGGEGLESNSAGQYLISHALCNAASIKSEKGWVWRALALVNMRRLGESGVFKELGNSTPLSHPLPYTSLPSVLVLCPLVNW